MRYPSDQLRQLRERWQRPLLAPENGLELEVDGCRTFQELLNLHLARIGEQALPLALRQAGVPGAPEEERAVLRAAWEERCDSLFAAMVEELKHHGLEEVVGIEPSRYPIREPYDLRGADLRQAVFCGAYLENAHFEGADLSRARFDGARCFETSFEDACCHQSSFAGAECHFAAFQGALCDHASFIGADCTMAGFQQARLRHARFDAAVCYAAVFDGAYLSQAALGAMQINHFTRFGRPGEQEEAERTRRPRRDRTSEGDDWCIVELFPVWLRAAEVNARIRALLRAHGYFLAADEYQYLEMVCRRHLLHRNRVSEFFEWFFKDLMFGYGLKWRRPLITVVAIILLWGLGFALHFGLATPRGFFTSLGSGLYYSVISFTTLGFGTPPDLESGWAKALLCSEALLGTVLMPLFLLAYARKILQD